MPAAQAAEATLPNASEFTPGIQMRRTFQAILAAVKVLAIFCAVQNLQASPAYAQTAEGWKGWISSHPGTTDDYPSADAACRAQWNAYKGNLSRFIAAIPNVGNPNRANCLWTTFQYLCPQETGGGLNSCWVILPAWVELGCQPGYTPIQGKFCLKDPSPERPCDFNGGGSPNPEVGHPISLATCSKVLRATDYNSGDNEFEIRRTYRSVPYGRSAFMQTAPVGLAGGWNFDFMYELQLTGFSGSPSSPNAHLALVAPDGSAYDFTMQSGGAWSPNLTTGAAYAPKDLKIEYVGTLPSDLATLQSASTEWKFTDGDDTVWTFQTFTRPNSAAPYAVGRPISRVTREGYRWDFAYRSDASLQTITDSFGRQATINWSNFYISSLAAPPAGSLPYPEAVSSITLPDGTSLRYTFDPPAATAAPSTNYVQRLVKVERLNASSAVVGSTVYGYGDTRFPDAITEIKDHDGNQVASYSYDARGRAVSSKLAGGLDPYTVESTETSTEVVRSVSGPLGKIEDHHFAKISGGVRLTSVVGQATAGTAASTRSITYGSDNQVATITDDEGRITSYVRDSRGRPTTITEAVGTPQQRSATVTWHSTFNVPTQVQLGGLQVDFTYYPTGQLHTRTETDTTAHSLPYVTAGQSRTSTYTWTTGGRLASINGPKAVDSNGKDDTLTFAYDSAGNLQSSTNGLAQVTTFSNYDANGRPGAITDPNNVVTNITYDVFGRTKSLTTKHPTTSSLDAITSIDYDVNGRVTGITTPATDKIFVDYNPAGHLLAVRAASGERIDYLTDAQGNVTGKTVRRADGSAIQSITRTFDELGRVIAQAVGPIRKASWTYDKVGNPEQFTSGRNHSTQAAYDPLNRLVSTVSADTGTTATTYGSLDMAASFTDAKSVQTTFVRNGFGEAIQETSPDRGTSTFYYNAAGELTASIDGRGQRVDFDRDVLGRIIGKLPVGKSAEAVAYVWDIAGLAGSKGVGRLSSMTDATGTTSFAYDHRGNVIAKRQTVGSGTADLAYAYDLADRITQVTYPSGRIVAYSRDAKGRVTSVSTKASASDPNWATLASNMTYEAWGALTNAQFGNGLSLAQTWFQGRLASKRLFNTSAGTDLSKLSYAYDADDNLAAVRDHVDPTNDTYFGYDSRNRLSFISRTVSSPSFATETYSYNTGTNRLASLTTSAGVRTVTYDNRGNSIAESRPGSASVSLSYDGYGRLLSYTRTGDPAQSNSYNGLDERVGATSGSVVHAFVYDLEGRLIGEYGTSATDVVAETIWLSPDVVAESKLPFGGQDGAAGYAPLAVVTGSSTSTAIHWVHGNHLGVPLLTTDGTGAVATPPAHTVAGFPGQTRTLGDIYYNRYRDYDSSLGRYVQADLIGLAGGTNPYLYANANPLRYIDRDGKVPAIAVVIAGGIIEGVIIDYLMQKYWEQRQCIDKRRMLLSGLVGGATAPVAAAVAPFISRGFGWASGRISSRLGRGGADGGPLAGGGASLNNLAPGDISRIQNAANRTQTEISVVGSRARGTARSGSDWDYVLPPGTSGRTRHSLSSSLPEGPRGLGEPRLQDFYIEPVRTTDPYITFFPG